MNCYHLPEQFIRKVLKKMKKQVTIRQNPLKQREKAKRGIGCRKYRVN